MQIAVLGCLFILTVAASQTGCVSPAPPVHLYQIGDRVELGSVVYNVLEADWRPQLSEAAMVRFPAHRFLVVRLSVTNGGGQPVSIPSFKLVDDGGRVFDESFDGQFVPSWLGLMRKVKPVETLVGNILFDVDAKSYKLKLNDDGDSGQPALVEMPLRFGLERPAVPSALDTPLR
ncbi:MAG TPA: DUF4352 domain-containing protein [Bryobacteraceae bacterium]|nr:DUF4352 domain-containing protein [Bryobacteraceae bacterium]